MSHLFKNERIPRLNMFFIFISQTTKVKETCPKKIESKKLDITDLKTSRRTLKDEEPNFSHELLPQSKYLTTLEILIMYHTSRNYYLPPIQLNKYLLLNIKSNY
uniref:Uncharacterized protein n=1 Tax=Cacopsylla melanoneura TaxID=428564 RepID=A0A8D8R4M0_9HEMI